MDGATLTSESLAVAATRRDGDTFATAAEPHYGPLVRRLTLVLGDREAAQDIAQETYLRAYRAWTTFSGDDPRAWLYTIGLRLAFNERRRARRWLGALARTQPQTWQDGHDPDLAAALAKLDSRPRAALLLNAVDGYTLRETASILGVPEGTVSSWVSRARQILREELATRT
jgi:RNA polymerase sigma-70 factor (ECF subfamily)